MNILQNTLIEQIKSNVRQHWISVVHALSEREYSNIKINLLSQNRIYIILILLKLLLIHKV